MIKVILILILAYIFLIFAPTAVSFFVVFKPRPLDKLHDVNLDEEHFLKYKEEILQAKKQLDTIKHYEVNIIAKDGTELVGIYYDGGYDKTIIFMHGYHAKPLENFYVFSKDIYAKGYNMLFPYQRAHGKSKGKHTTLALYEKHDVLSWLDWADKRSKEIIIYGMSMGCAALGYASSSISNPKVKTLIMDCGFSSPYDQMANDSKRRHLPWFMTMPVVVLLGKIFLHDDIRRKVAQDLKLNKIPTVFMHGTIDKTVPIEQGIFNYNSNNSDKIFIEEKNAKHMATYLEASSQTRDKIFDFIEKYSGEK